MGARSLGVPAVAQGACVGGANQFAVDVEFQAYHADIIAGIRFDRYRSSDFCTADGIQDADDWASTSIRTATSVVAEPILE